MRATPAETNQEAESPLEPAPRGRLATFWRDTGPTAWLAVTAIAAASFLACLHVHRAAEAADADRHRLLHREAVEEVQARIENYRRGLLGVAGLFAADEAVSREAFRRAVAAADPAENYPAAVAFGYIRRVPLGDEPRFLGTVRETGEPAFALRSLPGAGGAGRAVAADRLVVTYCEPHERNAAALGLDIGTDPDRRATAERATATGDLALSRPLTLVQAAEQGPGLLAMLPVESAVAGPGGEPAAGWVYAALLPRRLFEDLNPGPRREVGVGLTATAADGSPVAMGGLPVAPEAAPGHLPPIRTPLAAGGRRWTLETRATPAFARASTLAAWLVKAAGLVSTVLTFALFSVPAIERRRGRREARRFAAELGRVREQAATDALTGLPNRVAILSALEEAVEEDRWRIDRHHAVLFLDFDRFKELNDTRGHAAGDELLRRISGRLLRELRGRDAAGRGRRGRRAAGDGSPGGERRGGAVPARLGGDEFVVLLRDLARPEDAEEVARRLLARLSRPYQLSAGGPAVHSTPSIGVAVGGPDLREPASLLAAADAAMYAAKDAGRACIRVHGGGEAVTLAA